MSLKRRSFLAGLAATCLAPQISATPETHAEKLIASARGQIGQTLHYDGSYQSLTYPGGDVDIARGVCTDVIIRAYRDALGFDFQKAVHEDMCEDFAAYPSLWGLTRPDRNIDHRRVPNLETYLTRQGASRDLPDDLSSLMPGDLLTMRLPGNLPHIAIVSDRKSHTGEPRILHNIGRGAAEDRLDTALQQTLTSRFRHLDDLPDHRLAP